MKTITRAALVLLLATPASAFAQSAGTDGQQPASPSSHKEISLSFNGPQHPYAEFPGLALAGVQKTDFGVAVVGEVDLSYVRTTISAGPRIYAGGARLANGGVTVAAFAQVLGGATIGGREGIINSTGGATVQPGVGLTMGGRRHAFQVQVDYRIVSGGQILDDHMPGLTRKMTGKRISLGWVWRFGG